MKELSLQELQAESLKILKDVHTFCVENKIMYSVAYGTLIGAIRHKGFIPWDDDIDIMMPRPDYDRFCNSFQSSRYKIKSPEKDKDCMIAFARVYDDKCTIIDTVIPWCGEKSGVWIDVFPMDTVPDDVLFKDKPAYKKAVKSWKISIPARGALSSFRKDKPIIFNLKLIAKKILFRRNSARKYIDKVLYCQHLLDWGSTRHWSQLSYFDQMGWFNMDDFVGAELMPFEDSEVMVMNGYDNVLRESYGDYMQLPPEEERSGHTVGATKFYWKESE